MFISQFFLSACARTCVNQRQQNKTYYVYFEIFNWQITHTRCVCFTMNEFFFNEVTESFWPGLYITIVNRDMVWKLGKLQSAYNELRFDVGTVLT